MSTILGTPNGPLLLTFLDPFVWCIIIISATQYPLQFINTPQSRLVKEESSSHSLLLIWILHPKKREEGEEREKGKMCSSGGLFLIFSIVLFSALATLTPVSATDHIVGANKGWNPGINYTLWANNHTFYVGDLISFRYQKNQYNVFEVNKTGYDNCTTEGAVGNWSSGKDFIPLNKAKRYYFICGNGQCFNGMKVSVVVHPLPPPPTAAMAHEFSSHNSTAAMVPRPGFRSLAVSLALILFGSMGI